MKNIFTCLTALTVIASIAATSCQKDETICNNNITMGNIDGETIISDQGNTFDITESVFEVNLNSFPYGRVMFSCDVLKKTSENRYDIRLTGITSVLTKESVAASSIVPDSELSVEDPINIRDIWRGGGYLNMLIEFAQKVGSDTKHWINLIYHDESAAEMGESGLPKYTFTLRHNAYGEVPNGDEETEYTSSYGYVSFPVSGIIEGDKAEIIMNWTSFEFWDGTSGIIGVEEHSENFTWTREGYEHKNLTVTRPTLKLCKNFSAR